MPENGNVPPIEPREARANASKEREKLFSEVQGRLDKAYAVNVKTYNLRRRIPELRVGQLVYRMNFAQFDASK